MGQFSWLDCIDESQILDDVHADVYALIPKEFGGGSLHETFYKGYGEFDGKDIYDLVAIWNRKFLAENPNYIIPSRETKVSECRWYKFFADMSMTAEDAVKAWTKADVKEGYMLHGFEHELRIIGIDIACYDEDNAALPYPIKITHDANRCYESCDPSDSDPDQGWYYGCEEDDEEEDEEFLSVYDLDDAQIDQLKEAMWYHEDAFDGKLHEEYEFWMNIPRCEVEDYYSGTVFTADDFWF